MQPNAQLTHVAVETELARLGVERNKLQKAARLAPLTRLGYAYDWRMFTAWCASMRRQPMPADPETVSLYLTHVLTSGKKVVTASRRSSAIAYIHREHGHESPVAPECRQLLRGAQRIRAERPRQMRPLSIALLARMAGELARIGDALALRDRAILLFGFASALRQCNLTMIELSDLDFVAQGIVLHVRREKQDQVAAGRLIGVPYAKRTEVCPVRGLRTWIGVRGEFAGPLFTHVRGRRERGLDPEAIERMVKRRLRLIGVEPEGYGGHSIRAAFITEAAEANVSELLIATQSGHRSMSVLRQYVRRSQLFKANACTAIGL